MPTTRPVLTVDTVYATASDLIAAAHKLEEAAEANELHGTPLTWDTVDGAVQDALAALKEVQR